MVKYGFDNESEGHWRFPQLERQEGESMREVGEGSFLAKLQQKCDIYVNN